MNTPTAALPAAIPIHPWLKRLKLAFVPGPMTTMLDDLVAGLLARFKALGHTVQKAPDDQTDVILTSATFGQVVPWRKALMFSARRRFKLGRQPVIYTLIPASPSQFEHSLAAYHRALTKQPPDPSDFQFPGLSPRAHSVLIEQGLRGGPILALVRQLQAQAKSIRILLALGDRRPERLYHFDLVGAHPYSQAADREAFYTDIVLRVVTTESTHEVTDHQVAAEPITLGEWRSAPGPQAMRTAGREIGARNFFTDMIRISDLVHVPVVNESVSSQYSEGCFATWDVSLDGLIATVTGSARPVDKGNISDDDLAVIVGVRPDAQGALVRHVQGKRNDPPSSEAVEMMDMDSVLPKIVLGEGWDVQAQVPVIRSKLHGHRGVRAYNPKWVEYVPLDPPFYHYLVSCATAAQAKGIKSAFARAECLRNPDDPRQAAFSVLPGHGVVMVEKWVAGKQPFQILWEFMDSGDLQVDKYIPQGPMGYELSPEGVLVLRE